MGNDTWVNTWDVLMTPCCRTICLTDPSNNQSVKDEGAQIFYSIQLQTKPIGIGANYENLSQSLPHNAASTT